MYRIEIKRSALKKTISNCAVDNKKIVEAIDKLANNPKPVEAKN